jgi:hypothetical protein
MRLSDNKVKLDMIKILAYNLFHSNAGEKTMIVQEQDFNGGGFTFFARSDLVVVDYTSENADMDNPRGAIYGESWYVVCENRKGRRWASRLSYSNAEEANERASASADFLAQGKRLDQANWFEIDPCYGSEAYQAQGIEAQRCEQDRNNNI